MITDREALEALAKKTVSSELYYDLCDCIDDMSDTELIELIACNGDYDREIELGDKITEEAKNEYITAKKRPV